MNEVSFIQLMNSTKEVNDKLGSQAGALGGLL